MDSAHENTVIRYTASADERRYLHTICRSDSIEIHRTMHIRPLHPPSCIECYLGNGDHGSRAYGLAHGSQPRNPNRSRCKFIPNRCR